MKTKSILILVLMLITLSIATLSCKKDGAATEEEANSVQPIPQGPIGTTNGIFSVSNTEKVYFSKGNLQYQAYTNTWRFAKHQWDVVGDNRFGNVYENGQKCNNALLSSCYSGWIDLFGWGTSGYNHGAVCYQPWSISKNSDDYKAYGDGSFNLNNQSGMADWGYNAISNGGNVENLWRTLSKYEWTFLFIQRVTNTGIRFAKARVNNVDGIIILPDNWIKSNYNLNKTNSFDAQYTSNIISETDWLDRLESCGAVFLPAASYRMGVSYIENSSPLKGYYWSSTKNYYCEFNNNQLFIGGRSLYEGLSVRLVRNTQ